MTTPVRLQLSRKKGFNLQKLSRETNGLDAVRVARPSRWGNPWRVENIEGSRGLFNLLGSDWSSIGGSFLWDRYFTSEGDVVRDVAKVAFRRVQHEAAVGMYRGLLLAIKQCEPEALTAFVAPLKGKNLACFCPEHLPCHAAVLLEIANR